MSPPSPGSRSRPSGSSRRVRPALRSSAGCATPPDRSTRVVIGTPSPRAPGRAATGTEYTLPLSPNTNRLSTVRHSNAPYSAVAGLERELGDVVADAGARAHPAFLGDHDRDRFVDDLLLGHRLLRFLDQRAAVVAVLLLVGSISDDGRFMDDGLSRMSCSFSLRSSASSCWILIASRRASWRRRISRMSSAWRSDRLKARDQRRLRLVRLADDADDLVDVQQDALAAFQDVDAVVDLASELGAARDGGEAELDPFLQDRGRPFWRGRPSPPIITRLIDARIPARYAPAASA
jgi:hypothetical protein